MLKVHCQNCKKEFEKKFYQQKYCCLECSSKGYYDKVLRDKRGSIKGRRPIKCPNCNDFMKFNAVHICRDKNNLTEKQKEAYKRSIGHWKDEKNPSWKGEGVGESIHSYIKRRKVKPELCEICNKKQPKDLANISGEYKRDVNDYKWLCRGCHMLMDFDSGARKLKSGKYRGWSKYKKCQN